MIKYSLILPCYNVSKYILNCLESIVRNDMSSCEILLVDCHRAKNQRKKCAKFRSKKTTENGAQLSWLAVWNKVGACHQKLKMKDF